MKIHWIEETDSTNSYVRERGVAPMTMVCARRQTAGRGQRGNSWESEPGMNLTFSFSLEKTGIRPSQQFAISEAVALAIVALLDSYGIEAKVKWPNDIYAGDRKICGILIEHSILGDTISRSIAGVGLNVNQTVFLSDAPNPVSMRLLTGETYRLEEVAERLAEEFDKAMISVVTTPSIVHASYLERLWRGDGSLYPFRLADSGEAIYAKIAGVESSGHLLLLDTSGAMRRFAFKEVVFLLNS